VFDTANSALEEAAAVLLPHDAVPDAKADTAMTVCTVLEAYHASGARLEAKMAAATALDAKAPALELNLAAFDANEVAGAWPLAQSAVLAAVDARLLAHGAVLEANTTAGHRLDANVAMGCTSYAVLLPCSAAVQARSARLEPNAAPLLAKLPEG
jgi:hypothetical protein